MTDPPPETTTLPTEDLRDIFDIAVGSMDFGSGFLDTDCVEALRRIAVALGVDPMTATPSGFATQYPHEFRENRQLSGQLAVRKEYRHLYADKCDHCSQPAERHPDNLIRRP